MYIPTGEIRELRGLLSRRVAIVGERKRWLLRARSHLKAAGCPPQRRGRSITRLLESSLAAPDGLDATVADSVDLCQRMHATLTAELSRVEGLLHEKAKAIDAVQRLLTIPAVGERVALTVYAWVGDVRRFRSSRELGSYAGLVPSVRQSGEKAVLGSITRAGCPQRSGVCRPAAEQQDVSRLDEDPSQLGRMLSDRLAGPSSRTATCAGAPERTRARMEGWRPLAVRI